MRSLLTLTLIVCSVTMQAQTASISGKVTDKPGNTVAGAGVVLRNAQSQVIKITSADSTGRYEIPALKAGKYSLLFSMIGYDSLSTGMINIADATTYDVVLNPASKQLDGVTVTSKKLFVETKTDRLIINPDALISTAGSNVLEVLDKSPGIMVDENGGISLKGRSVVVFIDDKPTYMSGSQLAEFLKGQSAGTIDKIEIMSNPPAKYDAAGGGVINIRTKKTKVKGFNGNASLSYTQGVYPRSNNSINLNYRNNKFNLFGTLSHVLHNNFNDLTIDRDYTTAAGAPDYSFEQETFIRNTSKSLNLKLGADYYMNKSTTLGIVFNSNKRNFNGRTTNTSYVTDAVTGIDSIITADNRDKGSWSNNSINLNLRHDLGKPGHTLGMDADYLVYTYGNDQFFRNNSYYANGTAKHAHDLQGNLPAEIRILSVKGDYSYPLAEGFTADAGFKTSYTRTDNLASYYAGSGGVFGADYTRSNHFLYNESIAGAYLNASKEIGKLSIQAGLRIEHTTSEGQQLGNPQKADSSFSRNYTSLFPTIYLSYKPGDDGVHKINLSYGRRIDRPVYQDLNPFISPLDQFTNYVGNPLLRPVYNNGAELQHVYKGKITTSLSHYYIDDIIQESIEVYGNNYYSKPANVGQANISTFSVNGLLQPVKSWSINLYTDVQRRHYRGMLYTGLLDTAAWYGSVNITNQVTLKKGWSFEVSGYARTNLLAGQIVSGHLWTMNAGVQKKVLQNKGTIRLNVRDIFYTRLNWGYIKNLQHAKGYYHNQNDTRMVALSFNYSFGKVIQSKAKRAAGGATEEQNRVRS